ncbi:MAG: sigma-70 family RNA polymerase sigma factor [Oscillospiraceae bacterium]|nr:sigma-70 family RNA polymerase sigma factor [Oscillospiraceae bacterium]
MNHEFEILYQEYFPRIYAFLYKLTQSRDLAEELTQETFYQAFISFHRFRGDSDVFTWLASIGKHTYYRYLRKNKHHLENISTELLSVFASEHSEHLEDTIERQLMAESAKKILLSLPKKYQDVMILRIYAEMNYSQIGNALHISENSARVIYYRAKKMMLEAIQNEYDM